MRLKKSKPGNLKPLFRVTVKNYDGNESFIGFEKKMRIYSLYKGEDFSEWKLEVVYLPGVTNSGTFSCREDMLNAFKQWTEPALLKFISEGVW